MSMEVDGWEWESGNMRRGESGTCETVLDAESGAEAWQPASVGPRG